jgi:diguanylate cyclase (GGDEF)-like protein
LALSGWIFFSFTYPSPLGHDSTILILVSIVVARAAWDIWNNVRGSRIVAPAAAVVVLLAVVAATSILEALPPGTGKDLASEFSSPVMVLVWAVSLAFLTVCVLWLEVSQLYATMESAGMVDVVTGLSNRVTIIAEIVGEHSRSHRARTPFSIAIFEMDNFANVIDEHGQRAGDQMLKWAAGVIRENVRPYDKIGRYDAEGFLLMMPMTAEKESLGIAERTRQAIEKQACVVDGRPIGATVSVGVAVGERGADLDTVLQEADEAISRAKDEGRNRTVVAPLIGREAEAQVATADVEPSSMQASS